GKVYISDLKTTRDVSPGLFATDAAKMMYHMQMAYYKDGVEQVLGQQVEAVALIALEKKAPYNVAVYWLDDEDIDKGRQWYEFALRTYKRCVESGQWPGKQGSGQMLKLPKFTDYDAFPQFDWKEEQP